MERTKGDRNGGNRQLEAISCQQSGLILPQQRIQGRIRGIQRPFGSSFGSRIGLESNDLIMT
ncbi:MAG: hypothetical protein CMJ29_05190 [Phycisphaerae bacterium]|nr:hypothetical protein [Phycisphaerae bacterium]